MDIIHWENVEFLIFMFRLVGWILILSRSLGKVKIRDLLLLISISKLQDKRFTTIHLYIKVAMYWLNWECWTDWIRMFDCYALECIDGLYVDWIEKVWLLCTSMVILTVCVLNWSLDCILSWLFELLEWMEGKLLALSSFIYGVAYLVGVL